jgi:hypothetical protein
MKDLSLLEIYHKNLESKGYKLLKVSIVDSSSTLEKKLEFWANDSGRVLIEIIDENICFLYKEFVL